MDFFEQQDQARKKTGRLVFLFGIAVVLIIMTIYTVGVIAYAAVETYAYEESSYYNDPYQSQYTPPRPTGGGNDGKDDEDGGGSSSSAFGPTFEVGGMTIEVFNPTIFGVVSLFVLLTVGLGSLFKIRSLRGGGASVAMSMGGRLINPDTQEFKERQLLNIVEEMAIASGVPVPLVYVMDNEDAINAFAAGYTINDAAIAVTSGLLDKLNRDEIQGVVAHEYSHILNGDMRLNIRLIGVLFGILVIGNTGLWLIRIAAHTRGGRNNAAPLVLFAGGAILALVGYVGVFFGRLIKAAVSRQREFLADASAVQFTRNPKGISGALQKIGGFAGSRVEARQAEDLSHMFFSNAIGKMMFGGALATHPPLQDRISRIDRDFEQILKMSGGPQLGGGPPAGASGFAGGPPAGASGFSGGGAPAAGRPAPSRAVQGGVNAPVAAAAAAAATQAPTSGGPQTMRINAGEVVKQVGSMTSGHLAYTANVIAAIPPQLREATHSLLPAVGLIYSLLLDTDPAVRNKQMIHLERMSAPPIVQETKRIAAMLGQIHPKARIPLVEMCIPTLRQLAPHQYDQFKKELRMLVDADNEVTVFEFALENVILHRLDENFEQGDHGKISIKSFQPIIEDTRLLLSVLAHAGNEDPAECKKAFNAGLARLPGMLKGQTMLRKDDCDFDRLSSGLKRLGQAAPNIKEMLIDAAAHTALADSEVTLEEAELLRAVANTLDCPLPPFLG